MHCYTTTPRHILIHTNYMYQLTLTSKYSYPRTLRYWPTIRHKNTTISQIQQDSYNFKYKLKHQVLFDCKRQYNFNKLLVHSVLSMYLINIWYARTRIFDTYVRCVFNMYLITISDIATISVKYSRYSSRYSYDISKIHICTF